MSRRCSDGLMITVKTELLPPSKKKTQGFVTLPRTMNPSKKKLNLEWFMTLPRTINLDKG